jgi:DUF1365 family protein
MTHAPQQAPGQPAVPLIGFGSVRHARLRPARNAFVYPTYFLMLPMRSMHDAKAPAANTALARNRSAALSFFDSDHGDGRGPGEGGALAWLDALLHSEGIDDATGEVWLHCYPRVLGYTFKPVSFWYCHRASGDDNGSLRVIVAEVNNTFGERHCYLLDKPRLGVELGTDKVFHVSPFLKVEGRYRFRFMRAVHADAEKTIARVDYDDSDGPVLQTSVSGTLEPVTAESIRKALWRYPAMTLGVAFHIHTQAARLWLKRVKFIRKPALPDQFLTR